VPLFAFRTSGIPKGGTKKRGTSPLHRGEKRCKGGQEKNKQAEVMNDFAIQ